MKNKIYSLLIIGFTVTLIIAYFPKENYYDKEKYQQQIADDLIDCINRGECEEIKISKKQDCSPSKNIQVNTLLIKYFKECDLIKTVYAIAQAESSGRQVAINKNNNNGSWDCGYLQANTIHRNKNETYQDFCNRQMQLEENIKTAKNVYDKQGLKAWVQYNNGEYKKHLTSK